MSDRSATQSERPVIEIQQALRDLSGELGRLNQAVGSQVDLKGVDLVVLDVVGRKGPISPSQLAGSLGIHPATLTGILDRLEEGGWVERQADPTDRRRIAIAVIRRRGAEIARLYRPMSEAIVEICSSYSPTQLQTIRDFLQRAAEAGRHAVEVTSRTDGVRDRSEQGS